MRTDALSHTCLPAPPARLTTASSNALHVSCDDSQSDPVDSSAVPMEPPPSTGVDFLASQDATEAQQYEHYKGVIESHGGALDPKGATVLAIRGERPDHSIHRTVVCKGYTDTIVVLNRDSSGNPHVTTLLGSTYPSQVSYAGRGVSMIQPGNFRAIPNGLHYNMPSYHVRNLDEVSDRLPSWRDLNMDGRFSPEERREAFTAGEILFHRGNTDTVASAGCQNLPPPQMEQFIAAVGGPEASFNVTLVETGGY